MEKRKCVLIAAVLTVACLLVAAISADTIKNNVAPREPRTRTSPPIYPIIPNYAMQRAPTGQREQAQQESAKVRVLQERLKRLTVDKNAAEAELRKTQEELVRLHYVCAKVGVDINIIYDESIWPKQRFEPPLRVGQKALLDATNKLKVVQVIDGNNFIGELSMRWLSGQTWLPKKETVWVRGVNTAGHVDDSYVTFEKPMLVSGTTTYPNPAGSTKTVFVIEPTTWPEIEKDKMKFL